MPRGKAAAPEETGCGQPEEVFGYAVGGRQQLTSVAEAYPTSLSPLA
jgi:hypothetical protein